MTFRIGTTLESMVTFETLLGRDKDPKPTFHPFAVVRQMASGMSKGRGNPIASWNFGFLRQSERDSLASVITPPSSVVFIETQTNDNEDEFLIYQAIAHWPEDEGERKAATRRLNFVIRFTQLVEQESP